MEGPGRASNPFDTLPDELLARIIFLGTLGWQSQRTLSPPPEHQCRLAEVCSRFRRCVAEVERIAWGVDLKQFEDTQKAAVAREQLTVPRCKQNQTGKCDALGDWLQRDFGTTAVGLNKSSSRYSMRKHLEEDSISDARSPCPDPLLDTYFWRRLRYLQPTN